MKDYKGPDYVLFHTAGFSNWRFAKRRQWGDAFAVAVADAFNHKRPLPNAIQELLVKGRV